VAIRPGRLIGDVSAYSGLASPVDVVARGPGTLAKWDLRHVREFTASRPELRANLLRMVSMDLAVKLLDIVAVGPSLAGERRFRSDPRVLHDRKETASGARQVQCSRWVASARSRFSLTHFCSRRLGEVPERRRAVGASRRKALESHTYLLRDSPVPVGRIGTRWSVLGGLAVEVVFGSIASDAVDHVFGRLKHEAQRRRFDTALIIK
jgi:hypothetical protein